MSVDTLVEMLKRDEGWRAQVYDDATGKIIGPGSTVVGHPTIGYGFNCGAGGDELTLAEGDALLRNRAVRALQAAAMLVPNWVLLADEAQDVLGNMAYNLGKQGLSKFPKMLDAFNRRNYQEAAAEMKDSLWFTQVGERAQRLYELIVSL